MNRFYRVVGGRGFQVYRHVGHSASNSYIGSSRAINTVMEAVNVKDGDEIHALVGGTFLVSGGAVHELSLKVPKHIFETDRRAPDREIMDRYVKRGLATEIAKPARDPDYSGARQRAEKDFGEHHAPIIQLEPSIEFAEMRAAALAGIAPSGGTAAGWTVKGFDFNAYGGPSFVLTRDGVRVDLKHRNHGAYSVEVPLALDVAHPGGPIAPIEMERTKIFHFRDVDGLADPLKAASDFVAACGEAIAPAPGPRM